MSYFNNNKKVLTYEIAYNDYKRNNTKSTLLSSILISGAFTCIFLFFSIKLYNPDEILTAALVAIPMTILIGMLTLLFIFAYITECTTLRKLQNGYYPFISVTCINHEIEESLTNDSTIKYVITYRHPSGKIYTDIRYNDSRKKGEDAAIVNEDYYILVFNKHVQFRYNQKNWAIQFYNPL